MKIMNLNKGQCVVCGKDPFGLESIVKPEFAAVCGTPDGYHVTYSMCENHRKSCFSGAGTISGFPDVATLEEAIKNAIQHFDFQPEEDRRAKYLSTLHELHTSYKAFEKAGRLQLADKMVYQIIGMMESEDFEPREKILPYWLKLGELDIKTDQPERAATYLRKAFEYHQDIGDEKEMVSVGLLLAAALNINGDRAYRRGILHRAEKYYAKTGDTEKQIEIFNLLSEAYHGIDGKKEVEYARKAENLSMAVILKGKAA